MDNFSNNYDSEERPETQKNNQELGRGQKIAVGVLAVFAVIMVGMWMAQFKNNLSGPFSGKQINSLPSDQDNTEALTLKDTDGDGLTDYNELYLYKTSPYLEDSDSDGINDKEEIETGKDPNCPTGKNCGNAEIIEDGSGVNNDLLNDTVAPANENLSNDSSGVLGGKSSAENLRQMLLKSGMDQKLLDQISDEELMKSYSEILNKQ